MAGRFARDRPSPVDPVEWQILTKGNCIIACDGLNELRNWKYGSMEVVGVSYRCQSWRRWDMFRDMLRKGIDGGQAWNVSALL